MGMNHLFPKFKIEIQHLKESLAIQKVSLAKEVWRLLLPYKGEAQKTITTDNESEFAEHEWITRMPVAQVYFAESYCSWQKGVVEKQNKLIRQYKGNVHKKGNKR